MAEILIIGILTMALLFNFNQDIKRDKDISRLKNELVTTNIQVNDTRKNILPLNKKIENVNQEIKNIKTDVNENSEQISEAKQDIREEKEKRESAKIIYKE